MAGANVAAKQRIIDAALELWSEKGFARSTMRELARRLSLGVSALYDHFPTKESLVLAIYDQLNDEAVRQFRAVDEGETDLSQNLEKLLEIKLALLDPHRTSMVAIFREAVDPDSTLNPLSASSSGARHQSMSLMEELLRRSPAVSDSDASSLAPTLWLMHLVLILYWLHDHSESSKNTKRLVAKFAQAANMLPLLRAAPGADELLKLVSELFDHSKDEAPKPIASDLPATMLNYDIVVIGAGPIGMLYASFLKKARPGTSILVLERSTQPGHKIGESTLSGFCKALRSVGVSHEAMQRLFFPKNGLGFFHVDQSIRNLTQAPEYILETFDETFQVERRVLDSLVIANGRRLGVEVIEGAQVDENRSTFGSDGNVVTYEIGRRECRVRAKLVVDASGPSGVLGRHVGQYTDAGIPFQSGAVWAYFRNVKPLESYDWPRVAKFPRDEYTQHLCFREGWMWYIPLVSWQQSPDNNLSRMLDHLLHGENAPSRNHLAEQFGCPLSEIVSVGLVLRRDRDEQLRDDPRAAFEFYRNKYPAVRQMLDGAELLSDHYDLGHPFSSRVNFRRYARRTSGDGWLLIGDAAFFVDPLISPGLTGGTATAFMAAQASVEAIESGAAEQHKFAKYDEFVQTLHDALERDNQLVYMSFNHPEALALIQRFQEIDARRHFVTHESNEYGLADTNVWGILDDDYQALQKQLVMIMREEEQLVAGEVPVEEQTPRDYERMVERIQGCLSERLNEFVELTPFVGQNDKLPT